MRVLASHAIGPHTQHATVYPSDRYVEPEAEALTWRFWRKRRYIVVMMAFFGFCNVYSLRVNLSVGIVAMTEKRPVEYANGTVGYVRQTASRIVCNGI